MQKETRDTTCDTTCDTNNLPRRDYRHVRSTCGHTNSGVITFFLFAKAANASMNSEEFINDPRNPRFKAGGIKEEH